MLGHYVAKTCCRVYVECLAGDGTWKLGSPIGSKNVLKIDMSGDYCLNNDLRQNMFATQRIKVLYSKPIYIFAEKYWEFSELFS